MEDLITTATTTPGARPRRLRRTAALREAVAETVLRPRHLIHPMFVRAGTNIVRPIGSMPGHAQLTVDRLGHDTDE
ncbi:MAG TPA: hypothetical protein VFZ93_04950, partial [Albitalea sp.]